MARRQDTHLTQPGSEVQKILDEAHQTYDCPLSEVANPIIGDICVTPISLIPYDIPENYDGEQYIDIDSNNLVITEKEALPIDVGSTEFVVTVFADIPDTEIGPTAYLSGLVLDAFTADFPYEHTFPEEEEGVVLSYTKMTINPAWITDYFTFSRRTSLIYEYDGKQWVLASGPVTREDRKLWGRAGTALQPWDELNLDGGYAPIEQG